MNISIVPLKTDPESLTAQSPYPQSTQTCQCASVKNREPSDEKEVALVQLNREVTAPGLSVIHVLTVWVVVQEFEQTARLFAY